MAQESTLTSRDDEELLDADDNVEYAANFDDAARSVSSTDPEDESDEVAEARARVEETRTHLAETLDALTHKLSPANLVEEAKEATIHKAQETVAEVVDTVKEKASDVAEIVMEKAGGIADAVGGAYHAAVDHVTDAVHTATDAVTGAAHNVADRVNTFRHEHEAAVPDAPSRYDLTTVGSGSKPTIGETIMDTIKLNPVPAAIAGFGIGWLLLSAQRQYSATAPASVSPDIDDAALTPAGAYSSNFGTATNNVPSIDAPGLRDKAADIAHGVSDKASDLVHGVSDKASDLAHGVSDKASAITQSLSDKASDIKGRATDWAGTVRDNAGQLRDRAGDAVHNLGVQTKVQAGATTDYVGNFIKEQPLAAGAIALLLGAVVAYSLPSTQKENEVLGPKRDKLVDQGKDAAHDVAHKVQTVANAALGQAQQSLSQTVDQAKEQFQQTVQQTKDTVVTEAKNQGLAGAAA